MANPLADYVYTEIPVSRKRDEAFELLVRTEALGKARNILDDVCESLARELEGVVPHGIEALQAAITARITHDFKKIVAEVGAKAAYRTRELIKEDMSHAAWEAHDYALCIDRGESEDGVEPYSVRVYVNIDMQEIERLAVKDSSVGFCSIPYVKE